MVTEAVRKAQDLLAERRANIREMRAETDGMARAMLAGRVLELDYALALLRCPAYAAARLREEPENE